jgi:hypothetical protein
MALLFIIASRWPRFYSGILSGCSTERIASSISASTIVFAEVAMYVCRLYYSRDIIRDFHNSFQEKLQESD